MIGLNYGLNISCMLLVQIHRQILCTQDLCQKILTLQSMRGNIMQNQVKVSSCSERYAFLNFEPLQDSVYLSLLLSCVVYSKACEVLRTRSSELRLSLSKNFVSIFFFLHFSMLKCFALYFYQRNTIAQSYLTSAGGNHDFKLLLYHRGSISDRILSLHFFEIRIPFLAIFYLFLLFVLG